MLGRRLRQRHRLHYTGVGDDDVDAALLLLDRLVQAIEVGEVGDVALHDGDVAPEHALRLLELAGAAPGDEDVRALFDEPLRRRQADAAAAAADDRDLSVQFAHGVLLVAVAEGQHRLTRSVPVDRSGAEDLCSEVTNRDLGSARPRPPRRRPVAARRVNGTRLVRGSYESTNPRGPMDLLEKMATYIRVVESGSFSAAAKQLRISAAAVSRQIATLEDRLRAELVRRTTRSMSITPVGRSYSERCLRILREVDDAQGIGRTAATQGLLTVSSPFTFGLECIVPYASSFMTAHPGLRLDLRLEDRFVDLALEGIDVAVRVGSMAAPDRTDVVAH